MGLIGLAVVLWTFSRLDWAGQRGVGVSQKKRHWDESAQSPPRARPLGEGDRHGMRGAGNGLGVRQIDDQVRVGAVLTPLPAWVIVQALASGAPSWDGFRHR
jgi:hypothetical protein